MQERTSTSAKELKKWHTSKELQYNEMWSIYVHGNESQIEDTLQMLSPQDHQLPVSPSGGGEDEWHMTIIGLLDYLIKIIWLEILSTFILHGINAFAIFCIWTFVWLPLNFVFVTFLISIFEEEGWVVVLLCLFPFVCAGFGFHFLVLPWKTFQPYCTVQKLCHLHAVHISRDFGWMNT